MKKLYALWSNWLLRKIWKKFQYGDYIHIEKHSMGFRELSNITFKIEDVIWRGWCVPVMLQLRHFAGGCAMFYKLRHLTKFQVFPGVKPKFEIGQTITINNHSFVVKQCAPYVMPYEFTDNKYLTFRYHCVSTSTDGNINALEYDLSEMVNTSRMWNDLNNVAS